MKHWAVLAMFLSAVACGVIGCEDKHPRGEGPAEKAGEAIDDAGSKAAEAAKDAGREVGKDLEKAGEKIQDATR